MSEEQIRPLPDDPDAETILAMIDVQSEDWILSSPGDYQTAAVEAMRTDGTGHQQVIALEWPGRRNHSDELVTVRLLIAPEDAVGLAEVLMHTARWMLNRVRVVDGQHRTLGPL